jgi:phosphoketolase
MLFKKKQNKNDKLDESFEKVISEIQKIEDWNNPKKIEHYILDSCEHIIATTKEIEALKAEYRVITSYLEDIDKIKKLPKKEFSEISLVAKNIEDLERSKRIFKDTKPKLTDEQFLLISANEETIPETIKRMQSNEKYQSAVENDMRVLEAEKNTYEIERDDILHTNNSNISKNNARVNKKL